MLKIFKQKDLGKRDWGKEILLGMVSKKFSFKKLLIKQEIRVVFNTIEKNSVVFLFQESCSSGMIMVKES